MITLRLHIPFALLVSLMLVLLGPARINAQAVQTTSQYVNNTESSGHNITMPANVAAGDRLVMIVRPARGRTITSFPSSWTLLDSRSSSGVTYVFTKVAVASEPSMTVALSGSGRITAVTYRITGSDPETEPEVQIAGSNVNNPPSLTPSWGAESTLYLIAVTNRNSSTSVTSASVPTNYGSFVTAVNASSTSNTDRYTRVSSARRTSVVTDGSAEDPGAFNVTLDSPHAVTIAVRAQPITLSLSAPANTTVGTRVSYTVTRSVSTGAATVNLSSTGTSGVFYASSTSTTPITSLSIANGSTTGTVWFTATTAGTYTVSAAASGYVGASDEITFNVGTATALRFVQQPTTTIVNAAIQPAVSVEVVDAFGNRVTSSTAVVALQLENNPGTATLSGTVSRVATNGLAIFDDVSLSQPATGYTLRASATGLTAAISDPFDVLILSLSVFANPSSIPADGTSLSTITLLVTDSQSNPQSGRSVTVQTDNGTLFNGAVALSGPTTFQTDANGIVTLSLQASTLVGTARVTATLTGTSIESMAMVAFTDLPVLSAEFAEIDISNLVLESGTALQTGAVYLKTNAITIDGQQVDVRLSIFARESTVTDVLLDNDAVNPTRFQPELNSTSTSGGFMDFDLRFYVGTAQVRLKDFFVSPVDVDGSSSTISEYIELVDFTSYSLDATSQIVVQTGVRPGFTRFFGRPSSLNNISFDNTASFIASYEEPITVLPLRVGYTGSTAAAERRQHSIQFGVNAGNFTNPQITQKPRLLFEVTSYLESDSDNGSIITTGPITLLYPNGISFTGSNGGSIPGVTFANIPAGLTAVVTRVSDTEAVLSFTGNAVENGNGDDVTNVTVTFGNASFSNGNASLVNGATRNNLVIDFFDLGVPDLSQSTLTANPVQIPADGLTSATVTLRLKDGAGRSLTLSGLNVTMFATLGTLSAVQDNGNGTYSAILTSLDEGTSVIRAKLDGVDFEASATVLLVPAGKIYRSRASGSWNDVSIWERFNNGTWIPASLFPVAATPVTVTQSPIVSNNAVSSSTNTDVTSHVVTLPTGIESGDLLLFFWMDENDASTLGNLPTGWTSLYNVSSSSYRRVAMYRVADGTEPASFTVTTSTGETSARVVMRILKDTYQDVPVASAGVTGASASPNPPSLTSGFADVPTLWIAASHSTGDDNSPLPTAPSGYADLATAWSGSTGTSHVRMATAYRVTQAAATEDPGAFTLERSVTWFAHTIAVRGKNTLVTPAATSALIDSLHQVTVTAPLSMDNITIDSGGELRITASNVTITGGNQLIVEAAGILKLQSGNGLLQGEGSFISRSGSFLHTVSPDGFALSGALGKIRTQTRVYSTGANYVFDGTAAQVTGTGMPSVIHSLVVSNTAGVTLSQDVNVVGNLSLITGRLTVPSDRQLQLTAPNHVSSPSDLGDILLLEGAGYLNSSRQTPRLTVRETLTGSKGWRMLSSPVVTTYADLFQGLVTQGFSGSGFPSLSTNLMWWNESDGGTTLQGWRTPTTLNSAIPAGRGHFHYVFNGAARPDAPSQSYSDQLPVTVEVNGAEPVFNANNGSRFDWALTSSPRDTTNQSGAVYVDRVTADAGWNLIGNPTASTLDWDATNGWTKSRVSNTIYVWDPAISDYRVWNGTSGNLGSGLIAPFQAFWVKATNTNPSLTMSNAAKTLTATTFRGKEADSTEVDASVLSFRMDVDGRQAQTWLQFSESGRLGFDGQDAFRLGSPNTSWVTLHTRAPSADAAPMQINHLPTTFDEPTHLDLEIGAVEELEPVSGTFTLSWTRSDTWRDDLHVVLMDHETRTTRELSADGTVTFDYETPRSFAAKSAGGESLALPASPVAGSDVRAKLSESAYSRQTRFSLVVSNQPLDQYLPRTVALDQNYPNPFNPSTSIRFHLPETQRVRIDLFDMLGRHIGTLADGEYGAGSHQIDWNAAGLSSGVYLYRLTSGSEVITRKMTLLK